MIEDATELFLAHKGGRAMPWDPHSQQAQDDDKAAKIAQHAKTNPPNRTYRTHSNQRDDSFGATEAPGRPGDPTRTAAGAAAPQHPGADADRPFSWH